MLAKHGHSLLWQGGRARWSPEILSTSTILLFCNSVNILLPYLPWNKGVAYNEVACSVSPVVFHSACGWWAVAHSNIKYSFNKMFCDSLSESAPAYPHKLYSVVSCCFSFFTSISGLYSHDSRSFPQGWSRKPSHSCIFVSCLPCWEQGTMNLTGLFLRLYDGFKSHFPFASVTIRCVNKPQSFRM